jgi:hypothetical protein
MTWVSNSFVCGVPIAATGRDEVFKNNNYKKSIIF